MVTACEQRKKRLERIRQNPKNVSLEQLRQVLEDYGFSLDRVVGSHYIFRLKLKGELIRFSVPYRKPVKVVYINDALKIIDEIAQQLQDEDDEEQPD